MKSFCSGLAVAGLDAASADMRSGIAAVRRVTKRAEEETLANMMPIGCAMGLNCDC
jgi:hypothetical protein